MRRNADVMISSKKWIFSGLLIILIILSLFYHHDHISINNDITGIPPAIPENVWVSMALCWGHKVKTAGKSNFPYELAGKLSTKLWNKQTLAKVLFQIVICKSENFDQKEFQNYIQELTEAGAIVKILKIEDCDKCVLTAQLSRFLAFKETEVNENDVVVMSDVDTFPMKSKVLQPIWRHQDKLVWVFRYDTSVKYGFTFSMSFTGMRANTWAQILHYPKNTSDLIHIFNDRLQLQSLNTTWDYDQLIMTRAILESKMCSFPTQSSLWSSLNMDPIPYFADWKTCYRGEGMEDCNRNFVLKDCKHWHFLPNERDEELIEKYNEITGEAPIPSQMQKMAKDVKFELKKIFGFNS